MSFYVAYNPTKQLLTQDFNQCELFVANSKQKACFKKFKSEDLAKSFRGAFRSLFKGENHAFVDLEFTCAKRIKDYEFKNMQGEVLSIGICIINNAGNIVDTFYETVKPKYNSKLSDYCKELTHLSQEEIDGSKDLITVLNSACDFCEKYKIVKINCFGTTDYLQTKSG